MNWEGSSWLHFHKQVHLEMLDHLFEMIETKPKITLYHLLLGMVPKPEAVWESWSLWSRIR